MGRFRLIRPKTARSVEHVCLVRLTGAATEEDDEGALQNYHARMQRVLDYIDQHLDGDLDLETVSRVAAFSKFISPAVYGDLGLSVHRYVQLARLKRASYRLAYRDAESVTDIAMDAGYDAPDAFARAFRQRFGQSPSSFRKSPDWELWLAAFGPLENARSKLMQKTFTTDDVTIRDVAPTPVAIMEHRGDPATIGATIQRFIAWRKAAGLHPKTSPTFNVWRSERRPESPADYSMELCVGTDRPIEANGDRSKPARSLADVARCCASSATPTIWSPRRSTFITTDFRRAAKRRETSRSIATACFFPEVPEHETVAELFLPLK